PFLIVGNQDSTGMLAIGVRATQLRVQAQSPPLLRSAARKRPRGNCQGQKVAHMQHSATTSRWLVFLQGSPSSPEHLYKYLSSSNLRPRAQPLAAPKRAVEMAVSVRLQQETFREC